MREELGDLLWYVSAIATSCGLNLEDVAQENLRRTRDRYDQSPAAKSFNQLPVLDAEYPDNERFPRKMIVEFVEEVAPSGHLVAAMTLVSALSTAFPDGPVTTASGKQLGYAVGRPLGDSLTDNTRHADAYRFHDAIHFGFMAVLGWSPNTRALLRVKRKSNPQADEYEDGARAIFAEEGLAAVLSRLAKRRTGFVRKTSIDNEVIEIAKAATADLEVEALPGWIWRRAVSQGFIAMRQLADNGGGYLVADLDARKLTYHKVLSNGNDDME